MAEEPELEALFTGKRYLVKRGIKPGATGYIIFFEAKREDVGFDRVEFVARRCISAGYNFIGISPVLPDFYQLPEIDEVLKIVLEATKGFKRIGYGQSMGGFAILNYYWALKLDHVVAISPLATLHRHLIPWEKREPKLETIMAARGVTLDRVFTLGNPPYPSGIIMFDPHHIDAQHAAMIRTVHPKLVPIPTSFAGHSPFKVLHDAKLSGKWLPKFWANKFDIDAFLRDWHTERSKSAYVWHQASKLASKHDRIKTAISLGRKAIGLQTNFYEGQFDLANLLCSHMEYREAMGLFGTLIAVPKYTEKVRARLKSLADGVPDRMIAREFQRLADQHPDPTNETVRNKAKTVDAIFGR